MRYDRVDRRMVEQQRRRHLGRVLLPNHARELGRRERIKPRVHQRRVRPQLLPTSLRAAASTLLATVLWVRTWRAGSGRRTPDGGALNVTRRTRFGRRYSIGRRARLDLDA